MKNVKGYFSENLIDVGVSLIAYKIFGFEVTIVVVLSLIMADVAMIMKKIYEDVSQNQHFTPR